jgi:hypothetical protein
VDRKGKESNLSICEFCEEYQTGDCRLQLKTPKTMTCREFVPILNGFCAESADFVDPRQIIQMATYFGIKGAELRKVKQMAAREESSRLASAFKTTP